MRTVALVISMLSLSIGVLCAQTTATDGDWSANSAVLKNTVEADVTIRVGDIDNLGFGFPENFNPFTGKSTPTHAYPWQPKSTDVAGLDRILIGTGFGKVRQPCGNDGYSISAGKPVPINIPLTAVKGTKVTGATLTMFVDDFQSPELCSNYRVYLNGKRFNDLENIIRSLHQSGPIGKFISARIPAELLPELETGKLSLIITDSTSGAADGYAIDFVKLLINPKAVLYKNSISGFVRVKGAMTENGPEPDTAIVGAIVEVRGYGQTTTDADGKFTLNDIPAGLNVVEASADGFQSNSEMYDVIVDEQSEEKTIYLQRAKNVAFMGKHLKVGERLTLNNIQFNVNSADLRPESKTELDKLVTLMSENPRMEIELSGHTSSEGSVESNTVLSQKRVQSCKRYLISKGIDEGRLNAIGYGPTQPISDNTTEAGRERNRRVEMRVMKM